MPRFLQNDIARFWRTVAVDFAYKRRDRGGRGWALRTAKLRLSRKLAYAARLLACFSCELEGITSRAKQGLKSAVRVVDHLENKFALTPIDIVAEAIMNLPNPSDHAFQVMDAYDAFLALLDDDEKRKHLDELQPSQSDNDTVYDEARKIGHRFQDGLNGKFFGQDAPIRKLTEIYGVF